MVGRASRTALFALLLRAALLPAVLLLPGCRFFTASFFPGYLAQVEKSWDVGSDIDAFLADVGASEHALRPSVFVLTDSTGEDYGGLLLEMDSMPDKLLLMAGPSGGVQALNSTLLNQLHFTNSSGRFVVGRMFFAPGDLSSADDCEISLDGQAVSLGVSSNFRLTSEGSGKLYFQALNIGSVPWSLGTQIEVIIDSVNGGYELRGVYYDPLAANPLALVFFNGNMNQVFVFRIPSLPPPYTPLTGYYPPASFQDVDASRVIYTHKGIVVAQDRDAVLMDFNGNETDKRLSLGQGGDKSFSLDVEGEVFYIFDPESRTLYRGKTGW